MVPQPLATDPTPIYALIGVIVTVAGGWFANRLSNRAQNRQTDAQQSLGAGQLALSIATRADAQTQVQERRLNRLERWRRSVLDDWWPAHDLRDQAIEAEVRRLDPSFVIPDRQPWPPLEADEEPTPKK